MTVLTSSPKPVTAEKKDPSASDVSLNVTGVDVKGMMFRHPASVLMLDGRDCVFRSESQPELDGSVLAEFSYEGVNPQSRVSQGRVKLNQADPLGGFRVVVELEFAQTKKINLDQSSEPNAVRKPAALPAPTSMAATKIFAEPKPAPQTVPQPVRAQVQAPAPIPIPMPQPAPQDFDLPFHTHETVFAVPDPAQKEALPIRVQNVNSIPNPQEMDLSEIEQRIKSALALEIQGEVGHIKSAVSAEVEKALPAIVASKMEKMIREDVEKQIQFNFAGSLQALHNDVALQVERRLTQSPEIRAQLDGMTKSFFEQQEAQFRTAGDKAEEEISSRAAMLMASFEESLAGLESRVSASRTEMESAMAAMQHIKQEINEGMSFVQDAMQQLRDAEKPGIEKMQAQAAMQLKQWSNEFDSLLNTSATEKAIQFSLDMERRMAPHRQRADETIEKLGAMLQLLQGTARVQQERLNEQTAAAAANLEKQVRAFLVRLGGGA
ncbi:MAG TPA: hypothetical protein VFE02_19475 [Candidatus Acidoferrales bacterium]|nr:hypothetical protein [Candidatus Acidoferrales bacterium]